MINTKTVHKKETKNDIDVQSHDKIVEVIKAEVKEAVNEAVTEAVRDVLHQIETENQKEVPVQDNTAPPIESLVQTENIANQADQTVNASVQGSPTPDTAQVSSALYPPIADQSIAQPDNLNLQADGGTTQDYSEPKSKKLIYVILIVAIILGLGLAGFYLYKTKTIKVLMSKYLPASAPSSTGSNNPSPSIAPSIVVATTVPKSKITIKILNGSGIAGEAGILKDLLSESGFTDIVTGNSDEPDTATTSAIFDKLISKDHQASIEAILAKNFTKVVTKNSASPSAFMVLITTGERKK